MRFRSAVAWGGPALAAVMIVAGCSGSSSGNSAPATVVTATATATVTSSAPAGTAPAATPASSAPAGSTAPGRAAASGPGLCTPTVMTFRLGAGGGAAGTDYYPIIATNASQQPCVTTGFPGVAMLDATGRQIAQATRVTGTAAAPVTTIVVQPGQQISARLASSVLGDGGVTCPQSPALLFTLPDNTDSTRIVTGLPACTDGVSVGAFVRGTAGR